MKHKIFITITITITINITITIPFDSGDNVSFRFVFAAVKHTILSGIVDEIFNSSNDSDWWSSWNVFFQQQKT